MTLNKYFLSLGMSTFIGWIAFFTVSMKLNPFSDYNTALIHILFYFTGFLSLSGTFTIILALLHTRRDGGMQMYSHISNAFRQGVLLAFLIVSLLIIQAIGMLTWWYGMLVMIGVGFVEFLFLAKKH